MQLQQQHISSKPNQPLQSTEGKSPGPVLKGRDTGSDRVKIEKRVSFEAKISQLDEPVNTATPMEAKNRASTSTLTGNEVLGKRTFESKDCDESNERVSGRFQQHSIVIDVQGAGLPYFLEQDHEDLRRRSTKSRRKSKFNLSTFLF